jgi:hypothetical protein
MNKYVSPIIEMELIDVEDIMTVSQEESGTEGGSGNTTQNPNEGPMMPFSTYFG